MYIFLIYVGIQKQVVMEDLFWKKQTRPDQARPRQQNSKKRCEEKKGKMYIFLISAGVSKIQKQVVMEDLFLKKQKTNGRSFLKF